jgi:hypothetical protein
MQKERPMAAIHKISIVLIREAGQVTVEVDGQVVGSIRKRDGKFFGASAVDARNTEAKVFVTALGPLISTPLNNWGHYPPQAEQEREIGATAD